METSSLGILPPELRAHIYGYVLTVGSSIRFQRFISEVAEGSEDLECSWILDGRQQSLVKETVSFARVCKETYRETQALFFELNKFRLVANHPLSFDLINFSRFIGPIATEAMRMVTVKVGRYHVPSELRHMRQLFSYGALSKPFNALKELRDHGNSLGWQVIAAVHFTFLVDLRDDLNAVASLGVLQTPSLNHIVGTHDDLVGGNDDLASETTNEINAFSVDNADHLSDSLTTSENTEADSSLDTSHTAEIDDTTALLRNPSSNHNGAMHHVAFDVGIPLNSSTFDLSRMWEVLAQEPEIIKACMEFEFIRDVLEHCVEELYDAPIPFPEE